MQVEPQSNLVQLILDTAKQEADGIKEKDIIVIASKVIAVIKGTLIEIQKVQPGKKAMKIAKATGADPRVIQIILDNSDEILCAVPMYELAKKYGSLEKITRDEATAWEVMKNNPCELIIRQGNMMIGNAGLDFSNHPQGICSIPPRNLDKIAREIWQSIQEATGHEVAVIISDTEGWSPFAFGALDCALGSCGIEPNARNLAKKDLYGKPKFGGMDSIVDEVAAGAGLVMGQTSESTPVVIVRGFNYAKSEMGVSDYILDNTFLNMAMKEVLKYSIKVLGIKWLLKSLFGLGGSKKDKKKEK